MTASALGAYTQSTSFFDPRDPRHLVAILPAQTNISQPLSNALPSGSNLLVPDLMDRLAHFPEDSYDLRPTSHLVRFMNALIGEAGIGGVRKRYLMSRLQQAMSSTHFFDLDRFWGSIFGSARRADEVLGINPYTENATVAEWEGITAADAKYRERLFHLAQAINLGGTVPGLKTAAEAICGCPVDLIEIWALADSSGLRQHSPPGSHRTWNDVEIDFPTWNAIEGQIWSSIENPQPTGADLATWDQLQGEFPTWAATSGLTWNQVAASPGGTAVSGSGGIGRSPYLNRSEVIIRPRKPYPVNDPDPTVARNAALARAAEEWDLLRVLNRIKPAGVLLTIANGVELHTSVTIARLASDSEFWSVRATVKPRAQANAPLSNTYPVSAATRSPDADPVQSFDTHEVPVPAHTNTQGENVVYATEVVATRSYVEIGTLSQSGPDYETVTFASGPVAYTADKGVLDPRQAQAARWAQPGVVVAAPYAMTRTAVVSAT